MILDCIKFVGSRAGNIANSWKGPQILLKHKCIEIILATGKELIGIGPFWTLGMIAVVFVVFNFVSLKMYQIIPMPLYMFFPSVSVVIPGMICMILPVVVDVYESDAEVVAQWKYSCRRSSDIKLLSRQVRATKVLRINGGMLGFTLCQFTKGVKASYFFEVVNYTITAIMSVPVDNVCRAGLHCTGQ